MALLRGVNWEDLAYRGYELTLQKLTAIKNQWNINILRIPINREDWVNNYPNCLWNSGDLSNLKYRDALKNIQSWCQNLGITIIIDLHWETSHDKTHSGYCTSQCPCPATESLQPPIPDHDKTVAMWNLMAQEPAYKNNSLVWFEIWNEPHPSYSEFSKWKAIANDSVQAIRDQGANNICLVGGIDYATDISVWRGNYLTQSNVVYTSHPYDPSTKGSRAYQLDSLIGGVLSDGKPVYLSEFGAHWENSESQTWLINYALPWFDGIGRGAGIPTIPLGWIAWGMLSSPKLTTGDGITPSAYGQVIQNKLKENIACPDPQVAVTISEDSL